MRRRVRSPPRTLFRITPGESDMSARALKLPRLNYFSTSGLFLLGAIVALAFADVAVTALDPWAEMRRLMAGLIRPDFLSIEVMSVVWTVAFAVLGVALDAGARLYRPTDDRLPSRFLLQAGPLQSGRGAVVRLLRADRHAPFVGTANHGTDPDRGESVRSAGGDWRRLIVDEPHPLSHP